MKEEQTLDPVCAHSEVCRAVQAKPALCVGSSEDAFLLCCLLQLQRLEMASPRLTFREMSNMCLLSECSFFIVIAFWPNDLFCFYFLE